MRFLPKFPQRSWEKSVFGAFGREILRPKRSSWISSRVSGRLGGRGRAMGGIGAGGSPAGQGSGGIAEMLSPTLQKPLSFTLQKPLSFTLQKSLSLITFFHIAETAFPSLATRVGKPSTKNPRGAFPMTTVPGVSAARFAQKRPQMSRIDHK